MADKHSRPDAHERTAVFVRLPAADARTLDRAARELRQPKQDVVAGLVSRYLGPGEAPGGVEMGAYSFRADDADDVLTLDQLADLLQVDTAALVALAESGDLPGRCIGGEWRFSRAAVLRWLGQRD